MKNSVIIIGAGAAGLLAAKTLAAAGKKVTVLEGRNRLGGRIHTLYPGTPAKTELGAEFVHGNLPVTLGLLKEAGISQHVYTPQMWRYQNGRFRPEEEQTEGWEQLIGQLNTLKEDTPIGDFMQTFFPGGKYAALTKSVLQFVAGYDTADPAKASAFALRNEWESEDEDAQHYIPGGYQALIDYLAGECTAHGSDLQLNSIVNRIYWEPDSINAITDSGTGYQAEKLVIALPLGVLQANKVAFNPALPAHINAFNHIGFGAIIKVLLRFDQPFWEDEKYGGIKPHSYLFSNEQIPTWWTQGQGNALFTGWLGGNAALSLKDAAADELLAVALQSLVNLFKMGIAELKAKLVTAHIANWTADPLTLGSYAYDMPASNQARKLLMQPVADTLYFAGEYLYDGPAMGTVEAALDSGLKAAEMVLK